jgi:hypothetical protein
MAPIEPIIRASPRGQEIMDATIAVVEERLRRTIGTSRPWTPADYEFATFQLLDEGVLNSQITVPELLPELTVFDTRRARQGRGR